MFAQLGEIMNTRFTKANFIKFNRIATAAGIAATSLVFVSIGSPTLPAHAAVGDCSSAHPGNAGNVKTVRSAEIHRRIIELRTGSFSGSTWGWARMANPQRGDEIWMDFSQDGGRTWKQCGPYTADARQFSEAVTTSSDSNRKFRACGTASLGVFTQSEVKCTDWF